MGVDYFSGHLTHKVWHMAHAVANRKGVRIQVFFIREEGAGDLRGKQMCKGTNIPEVKVQYFSCN